MYGSPFEVDVLYFIASVREICDEVWDIFILLISLIIDNFYVDTFVGFKLCEIEALADTLEEFGVASWIITHVVEMPSWRRHMSWL